MSIEELGQQYLLQYKKVMERIKEIKQKNCNMCEEEKRLANLRIKELYSVALHLKEVGDMLVKYYRCSKKGRELK